MKFNIIYTAFLLFCVVTPLKFRLKTLRKRNDITKEDVKKLIGNNYTLGDKLGEGSFGTVYKITKGKKEYAFKVMKVNGKKEDLDAIKKESKFMKKLNGESAMKFEDLIEGKDDKGDVQLAGLVLEVLDGDLKSCMTNDNCAQTKIYDRPGELVKSLLKGLEVIHSKKIAHLDVKPDNIFFKGTKIKYGDFGISEEVEKKDDKIRPVRGTPGYIDTNGKGRESYVGLKTDVYALGIVFIQLADRQTAECFMDTSKCTDKQNKYIQQSYQGTYKYDFFNSLCTAGDNYLSANFDEFLKCLAVKHMIVPYEERKEASELLEILKEYKGNHKINKPSGLSKFIHGVTKMFKTHRKIERE